MSVAGLPNRAGGKEHSRKAEMGVVGENWAMEEMSAELGRWGLEPWD